MTEALKILVIDDSEDDRMLYRRELQKNTDPGYSIFEADDGEEGLRRIGEEQPACVLLDYSLPGRNGVEVLKRIRSRYPFVPVVMLTGQGNEAVAVTAIQEGAQNYITKSTITPETIKRVIRVAMEYCALQRRIHEQRATLEVFTRALAHDLKEPVRTIQSFLGLLAAHETFSDKEKGFFHHIQNAADRMHRLIDSVYFYTRLDDASQEIMREFCDAGQIVEEVKENIIRLIQERNASITYDSLPHVQTNRMQLLQVLQNLICNAIYHSTADPVIHIQARESGKEWQFRVADNGPGIREEYRERIFEPFKRMSGPKEQGLGLGLAICKKIVESHHGKIGYEPGPEGGSVFLFTIPKAAPADTEMDAGVKRESLPIKPVSTNGERLANILLVEDNEADVELTRIMLIGEAKLRFNLLVARDGHEALTVLHGEIPHAAPVDLVLLDINMPGMDGFELLERMQLEEALRRIPVVMCTTSTYDKDMERAKSLGVVGYMTKPAEMKKLKPVFERTNSVQLCTEGNGFALLRAA